LKTVAFQIKLGIITLVVKIPGDAVIPQEKLTCYLLVPRSKDDKSKFLAQAGFTQENPDDLLNAILQLVLTSDAVEDNINEYGVFYTVEGNLQGLNGRSLLVITIWLQSRDDESETIILSSIAVEITLADIYDKVNIEAE
jgi:hypothetical protein